MKYWGHRQDKISLVKTSKISTEYKAISAFGTWVVVIIMLTTLSLFAGKTEASEKKRMKNTADSLAISLNDVSESVSSFDSTSGLDDYLIVAMQRNPGLRSAYYRWIADLKKSDYAGSLPDPMFNYSYFVESVETRVGPQKQRFGLHQSFPRFQRNTSS